VRNQCHTISQRRQRNRYRQTGVIVTTKTSAEPQAAGRQDSLLQKRLMGICTAWCVLPWFDGVKRILRLLRIAALLRMPIVTGIAPRHPEVCAQFIARG